MIRRRHRSSAAADDVEFGRVSLATRRATNGVEAKSALSRKTRHVKRLGCGRQLPASSVRASVRQAGNRWNECAADLQIISQQRIVVANGQRQ